MQLFYLFSCCRFVFVFFQSKHECFAMSIFTNIKNLNKKYFNKGMINELISRPLNILSINRKRNIVGCVCACVCVYVPNSVIRFIVKDWRSKTQTNFQFPLMPHCGILIIFFFFQFWWWMTLMFCHHFWMAWFNSVLAEALERRK